jgi:hypothetical protein
MGGSVILRAAENLLAETADVIITSAVAMCGVADDAVQGLRIRLPDRDARRS